MGGLCSPVRSSGQGIGIDDDDSILAAFLSVVHCGIGNGHHLRGVSLAFVGEGDSNRERNLDSANRRELLVDQAHTFDHAMTDESGSVLGYAWKDHYELVAGIAGNDITRSGH